MECKLHHPIVVYTSTHLILYLRMTKKILLFLYASCARLCYEL